MILIVLYICMVIYIIFLFGLISWASDISKVSISDTSKILNNTKLDS